MNKISHVACYPFRYKGLPLVDVLILLDNDIDDWSIVEEYIRGN